MNNQGNFSLPGSGGFGNFTGQGGSAFSQNVGSAFGGAPVGSAFSQAGPLNQNPGGRGGGVQGAQRGSNRGGRGNSHQQQFESQANTNRGRGGGAPHNARGSSQHERGGGVGRAQNQPYDYAGQPGRGRGQGRGAGGFTNNQSFPQQQKMQNQPQVGQTNQQQYASAPQNQYRGKQRSVPASIRGPMHSKSGGDISMTVSGQSDSQMMDIDSSMNSSLSQQRSRGQRGNQQQAQNQDQRNKSQPPPNSLISQVIQGANKTTFQYRPQNQMAAADPREQQSQNQPFQGNSKPFANQRNPPAMNLSWQSNQGNSMRDSSDGQQRTSTKPSPTAYQQQTQPPQQKQTQPQPESQPQQNKNSSVISNKGKQNEMKSQKKPQQVQAQVPKQASSKPSSSTKKQEKEEDEPEYYQDNYYSEDEDGAEYGEEMYGEEDPESEDQEDDDSVSPIKFSNDEISQIYLMKKSLPELAKVCTHFITDNCKYDKACREKHDEKIKGQIVKLIRMKRKNEKGEDKATKPSPTVPKEVAPKKKLIDLRETVLKAPATSQKEQGQQPQEKPASQMKPNMSVGEITRNFKKEETKVADKVQAAPKKTLGSTFKPSKPVVGKTLEDEISSSQLAQPTSLQAFSSLQRQESVAANLTYQVIRDRVHNFMDEFVKIKSQPNLFIIPGKAECLGMCPDEEIHTRGEVEFSSVSKFERDDAGQNFNVLAIKSYQRSAADKVMNDKDKVRPPAVLFKTLEYLRDCISDLDRVADNRIPYSDPRKPSFNDVQSFFRDRAKSISQDFVIIDEPENKYMIQCLEQIIRYYIAVIHDIYLEGSEFAQHIKLINSNLSNLMASYKAVKNIYPDENDQYRQNCLKNETEFTCYYIINLANNKIEALQGIGELDIKYFKRDPKSFEFLKQSIRISLNIAMGDNAPEYFIILKRQRSYLIACLMLQFINQMRLQLLENINKSTHKADGIDLNFIAKMLLFDEIKDGLSFVIACGFQTLQNNRVYGKDRVSIEEDEQKQEFIKWKQEGGFSFMDALLGSKSRGDVMKLNLISSSATKLINKVPVSIPKQIFQLDKKSSLLEVSQDIKQKQLLLLKDKQQSLQEDLDSSIPPAKPLGDKTEIIKNKIIEEQPNKDREEQLRKEAEIASAKELALKQAQQQAAAEAERVRLQKIAEEKALMKRQTIEKIKKLVFKTVSQFNQQVKTSLITFFKEKRSLLVKRSHSASSLALDMQEINEEEYLDIILQKVPSIQLQKQISESFHEAQFQSRLASISSKQKDSFSFDKLVQDLLGQQQDTVLKLKLFYHPVNQHIASSSSDNLQALKEIFEQKQSKLNDKVRYKLSLEEFPSNDDERANQIMQKIIGSNLIVIFSSIKTLKGDLQKIRESLDLCPSFSRFSLLWIVNRDLEKNASSEEVKNLQEDKEIKQQLEELKRSEVIAFLQICTIYSSQIKIHQPQQKRQKGTSQLSQTPSQVQRNLLSQVVIKNIVLAFIKPNLEAALKSCKTYSVSKASIKMQKIKTVVSQALGQEVVNLLVNEKQEVLKHIKSLSSVKEIKAMDVFQRETSHEVEILNFLMGLTRTLLQPVAAKIKDTIQQISQQFAYSDYNLKTAQQLMKELDRLQTIMTAASNFYGVESDNMEDRVKIIEDQVKTKLVGFYENNKVQTQVAKKIAGLKTYDSTLPREPHISNYLGVTFYSIIMVPWLQGFAEEPFVFHDPNVSFNRPLSDLDFSTVVKPVKIRENQGNKQLAQSMPLIVSAPLPPETKLLMKRHAINPIEELKEQMKEEMDPLRVSNKRKEVEAKRCLDLTTIVTHANQLLSEKMQLASQQEEVSCKLSQEAAVTTIVASSRSKRVRYDCDIQAHAKELQEMEKLLLTKKGSGRKRQ